MISAQLRNPALEELSTQRSALEQQLTQLRRRDEMRLTTSRELCFVHARVLRNAREKVAGDAQASKERSAILRERFDALQQRALNAQTVDYTRNNLSQAKNKFLSGVEMLFGEWHLRQEQWQMKTIAALEVARQETDKRRALMRRVFDKEQQAHSLLAQRKHELMISQAQELSEALERDMQRGVLAAQTEQIDKVIAEASNQTTEGALAINAAKSSSGRAGEELSTHRSVTSADLAEHITALLEPTLAATAPLRQDTLAGVSVASANAARSAASSLEARRLGATMLQVGTFFPCN